MHAIVQYLWLIPVLPLAGAALGALLKPSQRRLAAALAIGSLGLSLLLSCAAFAATLHHGPELARATRNFEWFAFGNSSLQLGWVLDPLTAIMLLVVTFIGLLIFIYSTAYMAGDENFARFFCFLGLFAAAMLGIVISNSLLLLFICWELVGLASYLLIGFWHQKPSAAAAAKKAFITTRIGDLGFLLGMLWLYAQSGTLLFYDGGHGVLEQSTLTRLAALTTVGGLTLSGAISILIFFGAIGKSGQLPLHVWLPDAMEGPTPVSALIHAATMVAAGVFLVARMYPLMSAGVNPAALQVVTWVGAITAVFAACVAVAQDDIKRILAYSTVSQLGYMMMGLGMGGVSVGMFHLTTHAFFKALLFLGAGSVIHGCHAEQDIRKMGGLRKLMPLTFACYAVGTMALCGVPLFFSGFWSKDAILHSAHHWQVSQIPFYLGVAGAFLTAFYMTRQICYVFYGKTDAHAHESPPAMTLPLAVLAVFAIIVGFAGTPIWPWFASYLSGERASFDLAKLLEDGQIPVMVLSTAVVLAGAGLSAWIYGKAALAHRETDPLETLQPTLFAWLRGKLFIDELYDATVIRLNAAFARFSNWLDLTIWSGAVKLVAGLTRLISQVDRKVDEAVINQGFDGGCEGVRASGQLTARCQNGQTQRYLRAIAMGFCGLLLLLIWGCG
ncbi:MAG: NADH-quinone oxidoreductase subunit L [Limisphaerales bacterium]